MEMAGGVLEYVRNHDVAVMEAFDKVENGRTPLHVAIALRFSFFFLQILSLYQGRLLTMDSFASFCEITGMWEGGREGEVALESICLFLSLQGLLKWTRRRSCLNF